MGRGANTVATVIIVITVINYSTKGSKKPAWWGGLGGLEWQRKDTEDKPYEEDDPQKDDHPLRARRDVISHFSQDFPETINHAISSAISAASPSATLMRRSWSARPPGMGNIPMILLRLRPT